MFLFIPRLYFLLASYAIEAPTPLRIGLATVKPLATKPTTTPVIANHGKTACQYIRKTIYFRPENCSKGQ
jgi:hypothetical protein